MKTLRFLSLVLVVGLLSFQTSDTFITVSNQGISIEVPSDWKKLQMDNLAILVAENTQSPVYTLETNFAVEIDASFRSLNAYSKDWKNKIKKHPQLLKVNIMSEKDITFKNYPAREFIFSCKMNSFEATSKVIVVLVNDKIINLSTTSTTEKFNAIAPITDRIFDSVVIE